MDIKFQDSFESFMNAVYSLIHLFPIFFSLLKEFGFI